MFRKAARRISTTRSNFGALTETSDFVNGQNSPKYSSDANILKPVHRINRPYVLEAPKLLVPSFELTRRFGNLFSQLLYTFCYEKNFTVESLIRGANKGIHTIAHNFVDQKWDHMEHLVVKETVDDLRDARTGISKELEAALRFSPDDFVISFLHSAVISGRNVLKLNESRNISIYFTIVSYVQLSEKVPENATVAELCGKYQNEVLVCNATFSRVLNPLGVWKVTSGNFFLNN